MSFGDLGGFSPSTWCGIRVAISDVFVNKHIWIEHGLLAALCDERRSASEETTWEDERARCKRDAIEDEAYNI